MCCFCNAVCVANDLFLFVWLLFCLFQLLLLLFCALVVKVYQHTTETHCLCLLGHSASSFIPHSYHVQKSLSPAAPLFAVCVSTQYSMMQCVSECEFTYVCSLDVRVMICTIGVCG
eukprot:m.240087 g.240087  ORF g.240087 m.240087 type:complete len:116 (+) comp15299_c0_seq11:2708-3055(+)